MPRWMGFVLCVLAGEASLSLPDCASSRAWSRERAKSAGAASPAAPAARAASVQVLGEARALIRRQQYRAAEKLLLARLESAPQEPLELLEGALGEVYFCSGHDDTAIKWLNRSMARYDRSTPTLGVLGEQSRVAGLLADSYARQGKDADAIATLQRMYARYNHQDRADAGAQLALIGRLAALGAEEAGTAGSAKPLQQEIDWLVERLQADRDRLGVAGDDYIEGIVGLAKYLCHKQRFAQAAAMLQRLIQWCDARHYASDSISLRVRLAQVHREAKQADEEIAALEAALRLQREQQSASSAGDSAKAGSRLRQLFDTAEIQRRLADALFRGNRRPQAFKQLELAVRDYQAAREQVRLRTAEDGEQAEISENLLLERLVEIGERLLGSERPGNLSLRDSIRWHEELLVGCEQSLLPSDPRIGRLNVSLAGLYLENSQFDLVRTKLGQAREYWSQRRPLDAFMLVQTLTLVGETDLATASQDALREAAEALAEAAKLCEALPAEDQLRWWVRLNLGRLKAAQGHYRRALDDLDAIVTQQSGRTLSPKLRSLAMLYLGLLYKEQLQFDEALKLCRRAMELRDAELAADDPERLRYYSALAELYIARYDVAQHDDQSLEVVNQSAAKACAGLSQDHPSRATLEHQQAMAHFMKDQHSGSRNERQSARAIWEQLAATCQRTGQRAMQARALHYLSRLDYLDWTAEAKAWIQRLQAENPSDDDADLQALKTRITQYNDRRKQHDQSRKEYRQASETYDRTTDQRFETRQTAFQTLRTSYEAIQREHKQLDELAADLNQQRKELLKTHDAAVARRSAIEQRDRRRWKDLLEHGEKLAEQALGLLQDASIYPSLHHAVLCNQAQLLQAQSQLGSDRALLLERAVAALQKAAELIEDPRSATFAGDFLRAEFFAQYQSAFDLQVQLLVQAGQPAKALVAAEQGRTRTLLDQLWPEKLSHSFLAQRAARIVEQWRVSDQPLLYYYVGDAASYVFVLGGAQHAIQAFPLKATPGSGATGGNATCAYVADVVGQLLRTLREERNARQMLENPVIAQNMASASAVLMPPAVVAYLQQELARGASCVTVVPHESISQLPLEALLVGPAAARSYLVDCSPPLVYAPSLMVLDDLEQRQSASSTAPRLLTVGNPDYAAAGGEPGDSTAARRQRFLPLPETESECRAIGRSFAARFGAGSVELLMQSAASEGGFRAACQQSRFTLLHLAAHGILGDERGQPFGRIVLTQPASPPASKSEDGFLDLEEIRNLDLHACELAALSACNTNVGTAVGRQFNQANPRGGESGLLSARRNAALRLSQTDTCFSLAAAFLAAGSHRVLATQWEVDDPSTSALVVLYFEKITRELGAGRPLNYARLLAEARQELRASRPEFDTPFHWAPFVLIGPAQAAARDQAPQG